MDSLRQRYDRTSFPVFNDGDVYITITATRIYQLHSVVLRRCSKIFGELLSQAAAVKVPTKRKKDAKSARSYIEFTSEEGGWFGKFFLRVGKLLPVIHRRALNADYTPRAPTDNQTAFSSPSSRVADLH